MKIQTLFSFEPFHIQTPTLSPLALLFCPFGTFRSISLIHLMMRWQVHTTGSVFWFSHSDRLDCKICSKTGFSYLLFSFINILQTLLYNQRLFFQLGFSDVCLWCCCSFLVRFSAYGNCQDYSFWFVCVCVFTSLSKLRVCSSCIPSRRLFWWAFLETCRCFSRSVRVSVLRRRPSTRWVWKNWEYWGRPTSVSQAWATQWWSRSAALERLKHMSRIKERKNSFKI